MLQPIYMKKIKLAIFVDGDFIPSYDGASNRFHYLSRYLARNGIDLIIFHGYRGWSDISLIKKEPFKTYIFSIDTYYNNLNLIASILIREGINIIQFDNLEPVILQGIELSRLTGSKLVSEMHYVVRNLAKSLGAGSERLAEIEKIETEVGKNIDHLICLSGDDQSYLAEFLSLGPDQISVIPSGVDCNEIEFHGPDFQSRNIIFLGNLYFKPNEEAVRIIKDVVYPELVKKGFQFTIGGDCPRELSEELSDKGFTFTGVIPNLNELFKSATVALAPIFEGTGMRIKLLNYLAAGIPVLTTSIATNGFSQKEAFIIEDDCTKYPDIILKLIESQKDIVSMSKKGHETIQKFYDWDIIAKRSINIYQKILEQKEVEKCIPLKILKTKDPVWLQEAISKKRFDQIDNPDLKQEFSYSTVENDKVETFRLQRLVALEGMPGAGKTTFINNFVKDHPNIKLVPELEVKDLKLLHEDNLQTSQLFLLAEKQKSNFIEELSRKNNFILIDRSFLSTLAYCYARSKKLKNRDYQKLVEFYKKNRKDIIFPTEIIFLDVEIKKSIERRKKFASHPEYLNWFDEDFLSYFHDFYTLEITNFIDIEVNYLDTTSFSIDEVSNEIKRIL